MVVYGLCKGNLKQIPSLEGPGLQFHFKTLLRSLRNVTETNTSKTTLEEPANFSVREIFTLVRLKW